MRPTWRSPPEQKIRFEPFELDLQAEELSRDGRRLKLQGQPVQILALLLQRPGEVITREEIQQRLWPGDTFVDFEHSLNTAIRKLRAVLGDEAGTPRWIETLPKRGYRFIGTVSSDERTARLQQISQAAPKQWSRVRRQVVIAACLFVVVLSAVVTWQIHRPPATKIASIAVLPFSHFSKGEEQDYFTIGLTEELINGLSKINALRVISRTSVMRYENTDKPLPQIGRELGVDAIVEGSVQRSGNRVRITAQLVKLPSEKHVWAESYEVELKDILFVRDMISRAIAGEIRMVVSPRQESTQIVPEAYEAYLRGRHFTASWEDMPKSVPYFEEAIEKGPHYAKAYAALAQAYLELAYIEDAPLDEANPNRIRGKALAERALALDPNLAEAHANMAEVIFFIQWDWVGGEAEFRRAVEMDPHSVETRERYATALWVQGKFDRAMLELQQAHRLDPLSAVVNGHIAYVLEDSGRPLEAVEQFKKNIELDSSYANSYIGMGHALELLGRPEEAYAAYVKAAELNHLPAEKAKLLEAAFQKGGIKGFWRQRLEMLKSKKKYPPRDEAFIYVHLGEYDHALDLLEQEYREHRPQMCWIRGREVWQRLRGEPRYKKLLSNMKLSQ